MPITTYLPSKLSSEAARFKENTGNIKFDYRSATGSAPYLFSTPFTQSRLNSFVDIMPPIVPSASHITGDSTNYRRYVTDIAVTSDDFQRNVVLLHVNGDLIEVAYKETIYLEYMYEGSMVRELEHHFTFVDETTPNVKYSTVSHLILKAEEVVAGFVDTQKVVQLRLDDTLELTYAMYTDNLGNGERGILLTQTTHTDYGETETVVNPTLISNRIKNLRYFTGSKEATADNSFKTNVIYSSSFAKNGSVFSATNNSVLTDSNPNFYLYSKSIDYSQDILGYSFNISPNRGALLNLVDQSDDRVYIFNDSNAAIGKSYTFFGTEYTGLLSSPFLLLNFDFTSQTDTFKLKIGDEDEVIVGDYTANTFKYLCARLSDLLYEKGILVIPCKNNKVAFDRFDGEDSVEITLTSLYTKITTAPKFTSFEYLNSTKIINYDPELHPVNFTFTYVDEVDPDPSVPSTYPLTYKLNISKDTGRKTQYTSYKVRLKFDINSVRNTTQAFKLEVEEGTLDTTFTINDTDTIDVVLDTIGNAINNFLPSNYSVEKVYLSSSIDIVNNQATESTYIKVTTGPWMSIDPLFGGVYVENPDGSKTIVIKPNDGSNTITNDTGMLAFNSMYTAEHLLGITSLNPVTGEFSQVNYLTAVASEQAGGDYCYMLNEMNTKFREYGYEAIPLFTSTTSGVHYYIGFTRIVNSPSQTKIAIGVPSKSDAYAKKYYISGKDLYRISSQDGTRVKNTKGNASIEAWKDKVVPTPQGNTKQARAFEITEATPSLYKTSFTGSIANRDGINMTTVAQNGYFNLLATATLNPISDPAKTVIDLVNILSGQPNGWTPVTSVNGTVYSAERTGTAKVTLDTATMKITLKFTTPSRFFYCNSIGFDQENDLVIDNYAGWMKYPYGYNTNQSNYGILEVKPYIYMLITAYHANIDGA